MKNYEISAVRLGFGVAAASALAYVGCVIVMGTVPKEAAIRFFNSVMHGVDVAPIVRWDMPWWEVLVGIAEIFILGWLFGAIIAAFYNLTAPRREKT